MKILKSDKSIEYKSVLRMGFLLKLIVELSLTVSKIKYFLLFVFKKVG